MIWRKLGDDEFLKKGDLFNVSRTSDPNQFKAPENFFDVVAGLAGQPVDGMYLPCWRKEDGPRKLQLNQVFSKPLPLP